MTIRKFLRTYAGAILICYFLLYFLAEFQLFILTPWSFFISRRIIHWLAFVNVLLLVPFLMKYRMPREPVPLLLMTVLVAFIFIAVFLNAAFILMGN